MKIRTIRMGDGKWINRLDLKFEPTSTQNGKKTRMDVFLLVFRWSFLVTDLFTFTNSLSFRFVSFPFWFFFSWDEKMQDADSRLSPVLLVNGGDDAKSGRQNGHRTRR